MAEQCFYLGQAYGDNDRSVAGYVADAIAKLVELHINAKYSDWKLGSARPCIPHPAPFATDFFDSLDDSCGQFTTFLSGKHPSIDFNAAEEWCRLRKARDGDKSLVPDIISNDSGITEYYEIKSNSDSSIASGRQKVRNFNEMCAGLQIHYSEGTLYSPDGKQLIYTATWQGIPLKWYLRWRRVEGPIIGYQFCVEFSGATLEEASLFLALRIMLLMVVIARSPQAAAAAAAILLRITSPLVSSVGDAGTNHVDDVKYAQVLLNDWRGRNGRDVLTVDGVYDERLGDAIEDFSAAFQMASRTLEPGSLVIGMLEESHFQSALADATGGEDLTLSGFVDPVGLMLVSDDGDLLDLEDMGAAAWQYYLNRLHTEAA